MNEKATARLFFAVWPEPAVQARLHELALEIKAACGGKPPRQEAIHLTLVFLGEVPLARTPELTALAGEIKVPRFTMELNQVGAWRNNQIAWLAPDPAPPELMALAEELQRRLKAAKFVFDARRFTPHITLLRRARPLPVRRLERALRWDVHGFALMRSTLDAAGAEYTMLGSWPLTQSAGDADLPDK